MLFTNSGLTLTTLESNIAILTDQFRAFKAAFVTYFTKCLKTSSTLRLALWAVSLSFTDIALFATVMAEPEVTGLALCETISLSGRTKTLITHFGTTRTAFYHFKALVFIPISSIHYTGGTTIVSTPLTLLNASLTVIFLADLALSKNHRISCCALVLLSVITSGLKRFQSLSSLP